jgi:uncharacterized membrane protein
VGASPAAVAVLEAAALGAAGEQMSLFSPTPAIDHARVVEAIATAELRTSGEIRVLVAREEANDPVVSAQRHFERLGMTQTAQRNGVLLFVAPRSHTFAIVGDTGVHDKCGDSFWKEVASRMETRFRQGEFTTGLVEGIERAGGLLAQHFPREPGDKDELPNKVEEH